MRGEGRAVPPANVATLHPPWRAAASSAEGAVACGRSTAANTGCSMRAGVLLTVVALLLDAVALAAQAPASEAADSAALLGRTPSLGTALVASGRELLKALEDGVGDIALTGGEPSAVALPPRAAGPALHTHVQNTRHLRRFLPLLQRTYTCSPPTGPSTPCPSSCPTTPRS